MAFERNRGFIVMQSYSERKLCSDIFKYIHHPFLGITMISVQTRHIIARGRLYVNSLFADVSSPFLPTYWLGNYRMAKYDYEVSGRAWLYDRILPLASAAFPRSIIFPDFSAITKTRG